MRNKQKLLPEKMALPEEEAGQSIVLIAVTLFFLIMIVGLATDAGFLFAKVAEFGAAVDSAATAGVVDLNTDQGLVGARDRARQFLDANGWPQPATVLTGTSQIGDFGIPELSITVTTDLETFFLRSLGFDSLPVTRSATAAFYAQTDMLVATAYNRGIVNSAGQYIFGPDNCTQTGDAVSPIYAADATANIEYSLTDGIYTYRIHIPPTFLDDDDDDRVLISLFDPDSYNGNTGSLGHTFEHVNEDVFLDNCTSGGDGDQCVIETGDINPIWLVRVDETYGAFDSVNEVCPAATPLDQSGDTVTVFEVYVLDPLTNERVELTAYTSSNNAGWETDMRWVTPGVDGGINADFGTFNIDVVNDVPADAVGERYIYIDVHTTAGTAKNAWDLWAGPLDQWTFLTTVNNTWANALDPHFVNDRNLLLWRTAPKDEETWGLEVFAVGRLPLNNYYDGQQTIPLANIEPNAAGGTIFATVFDHDNGAVSPMTLNIEGVSPIDFNWTYNTTCTISCDNQWVLPQPSFGVPSLGDGTGLFFGGALTATYDPSSDEHTWYINITSGRPFLTR